MAKKFNALFASLTLTAALTAAAHAEDDVLSRIRPVGQVNVAGQKQEAASAPAKEAAAPAVSAPAAPPKEAAAPAAPAPAPAAAAPAAGGADGKTLYAAKGCNACHGADAKTTATPLYPKLAGQSKTYLLNQMKDIKSGNRHNGQTAAMKGIIATVSDAEMEAIAAWLSSLTP